MRDIATGVGGALDLNSASSLHKRVDAAKFMFSAQLPSSSRRRIRRTSAPSLNTRSRNIPLFHTEKSKRTFRFEWWIPSVKISLQHCTLEANTACFSWSNLNEARGAAEAELGPELVVRQKAK